MSFTSLYKLSGIDPEQSEMLEQSVSVKLKFLTVWIIFSIFLCSTSGAYLFYECTNSWIVSFFVFIILSTLLFSLNACLTSAAGSDVLMKESEFESWRPTKIRTYLFLIFALIFSQNILLFCYSHFYQDAIKSNIHNQKLIKKQFTINALNKKQDLLARDIAFQEEYLKQLKSTGKVPKIESKQGNKDTLFLENKRKAIVIGNQSYPSSPLNNPIKDANDISKELKKIGYGVREYVDVSQLDMEVALTDYYQTLRPGDVSFVYFSGHGFQDHGYNYLVPVDFNLQDRAKAVSLNVILESVSRKSPLASIVVIDACRNYMFGASGGLASTEAGTNTYIALPAKPGQYAQDGSPGSNGIFTEAILKNLSKQLDVDTLFRNVRKEVAEKTNNAQETWTSHSLNGSFILADPALEKITPEMAAKISQEISNTTDSSNIVCDVINSSSPTPKEIQNFAVCTSAKISKLKDDLISHQSAAEIIKKALNEDIKGSIVSTSDILNNFYMLYLHPYFTILGTILLVLVIMGGVLLRDVLSKEFIAYEKLSYLNSKNFIYEKTLRFKNLASKLPIANKEFIERAFLAENFISSRPIRDSLTIYYGEKGKDILLNTFKKATQ